MGNIVGLYESIITDPRLRGYRPETIIVRNNNDIYISIKDAAVVAKLSVERLRGLVSENRLDAIKPGGRDSFISLESVDTYLSTGKKDPGRPQKN